MRQTITLTVSQLNEYISAIFNSTEYLNSIYIKGEISNFTNHYKSGHFYFTLKDENSCLRAVMFKTNARNVPFIPENGMKVTAHGRVTVYERDGIYQLYCDELIPDGIGSLYLAYEQLKAKLESEGLFEISSKKPIPNYPEKIGIITAKTGAAIADITNILRRRYPICELVLYPAIVQGSDAPKSLIEGLRCLDGKVDTIIIGRGGGSIEDLWAFNDERLARTIYEMETPVISAVGHETDFTICDFVSDLRAPTPSAAAELAVPDILTLRNNLNSYTIRFNRIINGRIDTGRLRLKAISEKQFMRSPIYYLDKKRTDLLRVESRLSYSANKILNSKKTSFVEISSRLEALNPLSVLSRGYAAVYSKKDGSVITGVTSVQSNDKIRLVMKDGSIEAEVTEISKD